MGKIVLHEKKEYYLIYQYDSGFCEIKSKERHFSVELVHISELTFP
ncbi:hypothetical protein [Niallia sp. NCCP-28]|nr:hypothetical protein [Niallia sp. NCCP-28]GKU82626.1 hypothetical protein NCCP28_20220 [Niallia sp. NCCP-28]